jgi:uncharacterized protein
MTFKEIFDKYKTIAVYGMSKNPAKASNYVPALFVQNNYNIIPVNPTADEIDGLKCYHNLMDIPGEIDILNVFRPSEQAFAVVEEAVERKMQKGDIKLIWLQEGIINDDARELAESQGIEFIQDHCMMKEFNRL